MAEQQVVDGINISGWFQALDTFKQNPQMAQFRLRAHNEWVGGTHCRTTVKSFYGAGQERQHAKSFVLDADEPEVLLGEDHGPNATEALLYALASCLNTTFMYHAAAHKVKIDRLELELEGDLDLRGIAGISREVRNGFSEIRVKMHAAGDAPAEKLAQLCQMAQERSPVFDMVTHATPVKVNCETR